MDSITQATLGAAVGHAVLGEKMGNRAVLVGAIAGTIPDLDVLSRLFVDHQIYGLVYHRGITHSIAFTLVASPIFAWLSLLYYQKGWHQNKAIQQGLGTFWLLFYGLIVSGLGVGAYYSGSAILWTMAGLFAVGGFFVFKTIQTSILQRDLKTYEPSFWRWTAMYMLAFGTHWFIDTCTNYGTQIFEPFSSARITFSNISIVDPLYTVPMLIGLAGVLWGKQYRVERRWNRIGLALSTAYLALTFGLKAKMDSIVRAELDRQQIAYEDYAVYPSIMNTIMWQISIKTPDAFYYGTHSFISGKPTIDFTQLPRNQELLAPYEDHEYIQVLKWFTDGYYNLTENEDGSLTLNNVRFGLFGVPDDSTIPIEDRYIFRFHIVKENGKIDVLEDRDTDRINTKELARALMEGIKNS